MKVMLKLKQGKLLLSVLLPLVGLIALYFLLKMSVGREITRYMLSAASFVFAIYHFLILLRTRNFWYVISMLFYIFLPLTLLPVNRNLTGIFGITTGILIIFLFYMLFTRKIQFWNLEILELAARPVDESSDGFTPRPFPAGKAEYSRQDVVDISRFLAKHMIAFPYFKEEKVFLLISGNLLIHFLFLRKNYLKDTFICFDDNGNLSVNISRKDYQKYREELTFDQLCNSLADLFRNFLELYQNDEKNRILEIIRSL